MKIGFDLCFRLTGGTISWTASLFANLRKISPDLEAVIFTSRANVELGLLPACGEWIVEQNWLSPSVRFERARTLCDLGWQQLFLPSLVKKHRVDVLFSLGNRCPLRCSAKRVLLVGNALTIWPGVKSLPVGRVQRLHHLADGHMIASSARLADVVITESQFELDLLRDHFRVVPKGSFVLHNGRSALFERVPSADEIQVVLRRYSIPEKFILCVAAITCYSNHARLIQAYAQAMRQLRSSVPLVVCGEFRHSWVRSEVMNAVEECGIQGQVLFLGNLPRTELACLYRTCELMVFPSLVEGFAYTLVEAMACGAPVVCSRAPAMPETCGEAAVYFDPEVVDEMAAQIVRVFEDHGLRKTLSSRGPKRVSLLPNEHEVAEIILSVCKGESLENRRLQPEATRLFGFK